MNKFYNEQKGGSGVKPINGNAQPSSLKESTPNWPGLPGKATPDRSAGVAKAKSSIKQA